MSEKRKGLGRLSKDRTRSSMHHFSRIHPSNFFPTQFLPPPCLEMPPFFPLLPPTLPLSVPTAAFSALVNLAQESNCTGSLNMFECDLNILKCEPQKDLMLQVCFAFVCNKATSVATSWHKATAPPGTAIICGGSLWHPSRWKEKQRRVFGTLAA